MQRKRDFEFDLPAAQIAQAPADRRDGSRLLAVEPGGVEDLAFPALIDRLPADAVVVINDTRVIPARLHATKDTGGAVELLLLEAVGPGRWRAMARSSKPLREGARLALRRPDGSAGPSCRIASGRADDGTVEVELPDDAVDACGEVPLPPYIERPDGATDADRERYQTVYARVPGAVAAPTAGLHFTPPLLEALAARGATLAPLTLHVGLGTFAPVRGDFDDHVMHVERYDIPDDTAALVRSGRPVVAIGTTVVRALEGCVADRGAIETGPGQTRIFIRPGFRFRVVDHLVTNFHLPGSTLLALVSAFAGYDRVMSAYRHAVAAGYRFYSYGDAMLLHRDSEAA